MVDQAEYRIQVQGWMGAHWASLFEEMAIAYEQGEYGLPVTTMCGRVPDQAALRGLLSRLWDLNLTLISVTRVPAERAGAGQAEEGEEPR